MAMALPKYQQNENARFDFRVPDGLGGFLYLDWDDPDLKVEFRDSEGQLRFTANPESEPPLSKGNDEQGYYHYVDGIDLSEFSLGNVEAAVYGKVEGVQVEPWPTLMTAFQVIPAFGDEPLYTTADMVKAELPPDVPEELTDDIISRYIWDQSRRIDAYLGTCYTVPFPGIGDNPPTPAMVERACRKFVLHDCLMFLARDNRVAEDSPFAKDAMADIEKMLPAKGTPPIVRLEGYNGPAAVYHSDIERLDFPQDDAA